MGLAAMPAEPGTIAVYMRALADAGLAPIGAGASVGQRHEGRTAARAGPAPQKEEGCPR
jgi:hypothetical protein